MWQAEGYAVLRHGRSVRRPALGSQFQPDPVRENVGRLADAEWDLRYSKKLNRFIKRVTLKYPHADLDDTIYDPERLLDVRIIEKLAKCKWVEKGRNLKVTGQTGSGKSYLDNALAICALRQFKTVKYCKANQLIDELNRAAAMASYREALANLVSFILLVIDDFRVMQLDLNKCR